MAAPAYNEGIAITSVAAIDDGVSLSSGDQQHHVGIQNADTTNEVASKSASAMKDSSIPHQRIVRKHDVQRRAITADSKMSVETDEVQDVEKGAFTTIQLVEEHDKSHKVHDLFARVKPAIHVLVFLLFTGWWIAGLVLHRSDLGWVVPFLIWLAVTIRLVTFYLPTSVVMNPLATAWDATVYRGAMLIPKRLRLPIAAACTILIIVVGAFISPESQDNTRANRAVSLFGLGVFLAGLWATSRNRAAIKWHTVIVGMLLQFMIALFVLRTQTGCT